MRSRDEPDGGAVQCYCGLWRTSPVTLEAQGIPRGYCGLCDTCGGPGHTRAHPGGVPFTGAWCDAHYASLARGAAGAWPRVVVWLLVLGGVAYGALALWRLVR